MANGLRGQTSRIIGFVAAVVIGLCLAVAGLAGLSLTALGSPETGRSVAVMVGAVVVLGWTLVPLLFFGVDETLDPARFALLPVRRLTLARGMLAAGFVGVPPIATFVATSGLVVAAVIRFGPVAGVAALVGIVGGLTLGIVASRAITSAFAGLLRSRRMRDLAAVLIALLASSAGPLQLLLTNRLGRGDVGPFLGVSRVLAWTPLGAPYALPYDVAAGQWLPAVARLAITAGAIGLLLWWWSATLESAMFGVSTAGARPGKVGAVTPTAVDALMPAAIRRFVRPSPFGAIVARESRFWWRDPRRRAGLVSILMASAVVPIALNVASGRAAGTGSGAATGLSAVLFGFAVTMAGTIGGMMLANQFAFDGSAFATELLTHVPGRVELRARALAIALVVIPVQAVVVVAVSILADRFAQLPAGIGMLAAAFGSAAAAASVLSVLVPYALPDTSNAFALNSGGGSVKSLLALVAMIVTLVVTAPVIVLALFLQDVVGGPWIVLVVGVAYGVVIALAGTSIGGALLERRGPEVLIAVTPRR